MTRLGFSRLWTMEPVTSPQSAAALYVPLTLVNRLLAAGRLVAVAWLLGEAGKEEFGLYQPALELINWSAVLVMFGLGDVAERYASEFERGGQLRAFLRRHVRRLLVAGVGGGLLLAAAAPAAGGWIFGPAAAGGYGAYGTWLVWLAALNMIVLALYQWVAAVLRGLRAYGAAAGMESLAAVLLLGLSAAAAWQGGARALLAGYLVANVLACGFYGLRLRAYLRAAGQNVPLTPDAAAHAALDRFGRWSLARFALSMTFGFLSFWAVGWLARRGTGAAAAASQQTADYAMAYRMAQFLAYGGVTLWASSYGLAARAWSHGSRRRALALFMGVGRFGGVALLVGAVGVLLARPLIAWPLPASYGPAIETLLPPLLGAFIWLALLMFLVSLGDLQEKPFWGALLWTTALTVQAGMIFVPALLDRPLVADPRQSVVVASVTGLGAAVLILAPLLLWRPRRMTPTALPMAMIALAGGAFLVPVGYVAISASATVAAAVGVLLASGLLIRPMTGRKWRRWRLGRRAVSS